MTPRESGREAPPDSHRGRKVIPLAAGILFFLALRYLAGGATSVEAGPDLIKLRIFYSTDFHGALEPCG